ncbi:hypothetical protein [Limimaricola sp. AA108-03]|uniref:hypothetical protein n=1 Tax=Limimaricola sp. AA108-03 TaxID=3425945 RepID=UPI003D789171
MANQRLNATITIGGALSTSVGKALRGLRGGLEGVGDEIKQVTGRQKELSKQRGVYERQGRSVEALDREYEDLGRTLDALRRKQERWERAAVASNRVGERFRSTASEIGRAARIGGVGLTFAAGAAAAMTRNVASNMTEQQNWSKRLGVSTEFLSNLSYAAGQFGAENDAVIDGLKELSLRADEFAKTGKGSAEEAFTRLGFSRKEIKALSSDTEALFDAVKKKLEEVDNAGARQRIVDELLGGTAAEQMIEFLTIAQEEYVALKQESRRAGAEISSANGVIAREFERRYDRVGQILIGLQRTVGIAVMPGLTGGLERFGDLLIENRDEVAAFSETLVDRVGRALPAFLELASGAGWLADKTLTAVGTVAELIGGWEKLGIVIGATFGAHVALKIGGVIFAVGKLGLAVLGLTGVTGVARTAFSKLRETIVTEVGTSAAAAEAAGARMRRALNIRGALLAANLGIAALNLPDTPEGLGQHIQNRRASTEEGLRNAPVIGSMMRGFDNVVEWVHGPDDAAPSEPPAPSFGPTPPAPMRPATRPAPGRPTSRPEPGDEVQRRARGGPFGKGWRLVGEEGPELEFMSRTGFIATARETRGLAGLLERARAAMGGAFDGVAEDGAPAPAHQSPVAGGILAALRRLSALPGYATRGKAPDVPAGSQAARMADRPKLPGALMRSIRPAADRPAPAGQGLAAIADRAFAALDRVADLPGLQPVERSVPAAAERASAAPVTQHITINAAGMSVERLVAELECRRRDAASGALYDGVTDFGQYGRGFA